MAFQKRGITIFCMLLMVLLNYGLPAQDSARTRWVNGHKFLLHKVVAKETWSSVSRKYKLSIEDLQKANPGVAVLKISQIIQVPADPAAHEALAADEQAVTKQPPVQKENKKPVQLTAKQVHVVAKGETLYRISKMYNLTVDELKSLNHLTGSNVSTGQKLIVSNGMAVTKTEIHTESPLPVVTPVEENTKSNPAEIHPAVTAKTEVKSENKTVKDATMPVAVSTSAEHAATAAGDTKTESTSDKVIENGVATWMSDGELNQNKFYALHHSAPIGTIVKVTNRMNNNSVYVKVVGILPSTGEHDNVLIKITQAAAQRIGALDQRFQAELSYPK